MHRPSAQGEGGFVYPDLLSYYEVAQLANLGTKVTECPRPLESLGCHFQFFNSVKQGHLSMEACSVHGLPFRIGWSGSKNWCDNLALCIHREMDVSLLFKAYLLHWSHFIFCLLFLVVTDSWSHWSEWSGCDLSGTQFRTRQCDVLFPVGQQCSGDTTESRLCVSDSNSIPGKSRVPLVLPLIFFVLQTL